MMKIPHTHIVNESGRSGDIRYGAMLKSMGRSKGFPDYLVFPFNRSSSLSGSPYTGLAIEMKRRAGGKLSQEQESWLAILEGTGLETKVCYGFEEAKAFVESFL